jgi:hypothetical protein
MPDCMARCHDVRFWCVDSVVAQFFAHGWERSGQDPATQWQPIIKVAVRRLFKKIKRKFKKDTLGKERNFLLRPTDSRGQHRSLCSQRLFCF